MDSLAGIIQDFEAAWRGAPPRLEAFLPAAGDEPSRGACRSATTSRFFRAPRGGAALRFRCAPGIAATSATFPRAGSPYRASRGAPLSDRLPGDHAAPGSRAGAGVRLLLAA